MHRVKCIRLRDGGKTCLKYVESSIIDTKTNINRPKTHDFRWISSLNQLTLRPNCLEGAVGVLNGTKNEVVGMIIFPTLWIYDLWIFMEVPRLYPLITSTAPPSVVVYLTKKNLGFTVRYTNLHQQKPRSTKTKVTTCDPARKIARLMVNKKQHLIHLIAQNTPGKDRLNNTHM